MNNAFVLGCPPTTTPVTETMGDALAGVAPTTRATTAIAAKYFIVGSSNRKAPSASLRVVP